MPEITPLGWLHTVLGALAVLTGIYSLWKHGAITLDNRIGQFYLVATLITALTALAIFQRGTFGPGHALAIMTLLALAAGTLAAKTSIFGRWSAHLQALSYTGTLLFHMIPAVTDGLLRLPVGNPVLNSLESPLLKILYLLLLLIYLVIVAFQLRKISQDKQAAGV